MIFLPLLGVLYCSEIVQAVVARSIAGTWCSKSMAVVTGPQFFNPLTDSLLEPNHTGVSYSFTASGQYEMSIYTITANPTTPECPIGVLQWAHGTYTLPIDGSIVMVPIAVDGRQIISDPCTSTSSAYTRFSSNQTMQSYSIELDAYRAQWKLTLNRLYGIPVQPLYLVYDPPQMLPTTTLLPTATSKAKSKRSLGDTARPSRAGHQFSDYLWYSSMGMLFVGGFAYICL